MRRTVWSIAAAALVMTSAGVAPADASARGDVAPSAAPSVTSVVVARSQSTPWAYTSSTRQPRLVGSTAARRAMVKTWALARVAAHTEVIRRENAARVAAGCVESPRATISSTAAGSVLAGRWISVGMSFSSYPGCSGLALWSAQATATWSLATGARASLAGFVREATPLPQLIDILLPAGCHAVDGFRTRAPLARWTLTRTGVVFWLDKDEWGRMGACGSQRVRIPWSGLRLTPVGQRVAAFYGYSGGSGVVDQCWPYRTCTY